MKSIQTCSDYPNMITSILLKTEDEKSNINFEIGTELINEVATKVLNIKLKNNVDEIDEKETLLKLVIEDLEDVMMALKQMATIMKAE